jgi:hypothetical protein
MSKKLIAVASAAAIALSALVAVPASAAVSVAVAGYGGAGTATDPYTHDSLDTTGTVNWGSTTSTTRTGVRFVVTTSEEGAAVSVASTAGVKLTSTVTTSTTPVASTAGATSLSLTSNSSKTATFYAFTTSTTPGTVVVTTEGSSETYYVASRIGEAFKIVGTFPSSIAVGSTTTYAYYEVFDAFGNEVLGSDAKSWATSTIASFTVTRSAIGAVSAAAESWNTTAGKYRSLLSSAAAGTGAVSFTLSDNSSTIDSDFGDVVLTAFATVNGSSLADQVTALTAQVAALKADYNSLAAKYNKLVKKKKRVALK